MFGMEKFKKKKGDEPIPTVFEMEEAIKKHPHKKKELKEDIHGRISVIKKMMKESNNQKEQGQYALLLDGYSAMIKVINRI